MQGRALRSPMVQLRDAPEAFPVDTHEPTSASHPLVSSFLEERN